MPLKLRGAVFGASLLALGAALPAYADDTSSSYWDSFTLNAEAEAGITANPDSNARRINFGHLFTDKANQLVLNQAWIAAARPVDPKATGFDLGFRIQAMYGTDARYTHFLGEFDRLSAAREQFDIVEASLSAHLPWVFANGIDVKAGQYPTPIGFEVIEPTGNVFYTKSYIFNFGIPLKHTGGYVVAHVNDMIDLWGGGDTGVNTSAIIGDGDNNGAAAFLFGFGLNNLLDGKLTVLALSHIGPENARGSGTTPPYLFNPNSAYRYLNDVVVTYKATDSLTFVTEGNYIRDDGYHAIAWGAAQYATYTIDPSLSVSGRAEVYRDNNAFFVAAFPGNRDFVNVEYGLPSTAFNYGKATYSEFTLGLTYKPDVPDIIAGTMIRPEVRYDRELNGKDVYGRGTTPGQFTAAIDLTIPLAIISPPSAPPAPPPAPPPPAPPPPAPPAPPAPKPEAQRQFQVFFDFDKSVITSEAAGVLQQAADAAKAGNVVHIKVTGHTDTVGSVRYNLKLSERRAAAVKKTLITDGLTPAEISTIGVGKTDLLVPTPDGVREPQNRRATIEFE